MEKCTELATYFKRTLVLHKNMIVFTCKKIIVIHKFDLCFSSLFSRLPSLVEGLVAGQPVFKDVLKMCRCSFMSLPMSTQNHQIQVLILGRGLLNLHRLSISKINSINLFVWSSFHLAKKDC